MAFLLIALSILFIAVITWAALTQAHDQEKVIRAARGARGVPEGGPKPDAAPTINEAMICPHCQTKGQVSTIPWHPSRHLQGSKIAVALWVMLGTAYAAAILVLLTKAVNDRAGAVLTLLMPSLPLIAFGWTLVVMDRKVCEARTQAHCWQCANTWHF